MSLIQFEQPQAVPNHKQLIGTLQALYPSMFKAQILDQMPMQVFETVVIGALMAVSDDDFQKGFNRLMTNPPKFMPSIVEFKTWCTASNWLSANEAWHHACEYSKDDQHKITVLTKECWDAVYHIVLNGDMREAKNQFINTYEDRLARAIQKGATQAIYKAPVALPPPILERAVKPKQLDSEYESKLTALTQKYVGQGMSIVMAGMEAIKELKGEVA